MEILILVGLALLAYFIFKNALKAIGIILVGALIFGYVSSSDFDTKDFLNGTFDGYSSSSLFSSSDDSFFESKTTLKEGSIFNESENIPNEKGKLETWKDELTQKKNELKSNYENYKKINEIKEKSSDVLGGFF